MLFDVISSRNVRRCFLQSDWLLGYHMMSHNVNFIEQLTLDGFSGFDSQLYSTDNQPTGPKNQIWPRPMCAMKCAEHALLVYVNFRECAHILLGGVRDSKRRDRTIALAHIMSTSHKRSVSLVNK